MVRLHGDAPYKVILVHGGPGAIGSLKGFARELSETAKIGVVEAMQSKYSIAELIEELYDIVNITLHFFLKDVRPMLPLVMKHSTSVA